MIYDIRQECYDHLNWLCDRSREWTKYYKACLARSDKRIQSLLCQCEALIDERDKLDLRLRAMKK